VSSVDDEGGFGRARSISIFAFRLVFDRLVELVISIRLEVHDVSSPVLALCGRVTICRNPFNRLHILATGSYHHVGKLSHRS
jgi:hypothetical protein